MAGEYDLDGDRMFNGDTLNYADGWRTARRSARVGVR